MADGSNQDDLFSQLTKAPAAPVDSDVLVDGNTLSAFLDGLTTRRIRQLADDGIIPKSSRGKYPLKASIRGYIHFLKGTTGTTNSHSKAEREAELKGHQAERAAIELARIKGELIAVTDVRRRWLDIVSRVKVRLLSIPTRVGAMANSTPKTPRALSALVKSLIEETLTELADYDGQPVTASNSRKRPRAAKRSNGQRVGRRKPRTESRVGS